MAAPLPPEIDMRDTGEICRAIEEDAEGGFYISEEHTIADIYRWLVKEGYWPEIVTLNEIERGKS
jgi:hypothetical protein